MAGKRRHRQGNLATGGKLDRIAEQVAEHLAQLAQIPLDHRRQPGRIFQRQGDPLGRCLWPKQRAEFIHQLEQGEGFAARIHMARLYLGVVENVVEDLQQGFATVLDGGQIALLGIAQVGIFQQRQAPENAVHGGADLVAHGGEKHRLGPVGLLGLGAGLPLLLHLLIEPLVGVAELAGALLDPRLQLALIAAQLHRIVTKHLQGPAQLRQLIAPGTGDRLKGSQIPARQPAHPRHRPLQRPDDPAVDHAPHQQHQQ